MSNVVTVNQFCACRNCNCEALVDTKGIVCGECRDDPRCTGEGRRKYRAQLVGPITGMPDLNRQAFADAAEKVAACGYGVWNPNDWSDLSPDIDPGSQPKEFWMRRSIRKLFDVDMIVMLPGWRLSAGAKCEHEVAQQFGLPVVYWSEHPRAYRCEWRMA